MYILGVPVLIALMLLFVLILLLVNRWKMALVLLILCIALNKKTQTFPVHTSYAWSWDNEAVCDSTTLNIMTYNIGLSKDSSLLAYLDTLELDILCLQESGQLPEKNILQKHFPYYEGTSFYSKYPIRNCHRLILDEEDPQWELLQDSVLNPKNAFQKRIQIYSMQVELPQGTTNVITCHLHSNSYSTARREMEADAKWEDGIDEYLRRIAYGYRFRQVETSLIEKELKNIAPAPTLILGDFNDLSGSYTLKTLQGERLKNAWWEGGLGPGFTYNAFHLLLRLDHILYSPEFQLEQVFVDTDVSFSDHYPVRARFTLPF